MPRSTVSKRSKFGREINREKPPLCQPEAAFLVGLSDRPTKNVTGRDPGNDGVTEARAALLDWECVCMCWETGERPGKSQAVEDLETAWTSNARLGPHADHRLEVWAGVYWTQPLPSHWLTIKVCTQTAQPIGKQAYKIKVGTGKIATTEQMAGQIEGMNHVQAST